MKPAACESNAGGDHLSPQSIAGPRYEHHSAGSEGSGPKLPHCLPESLMLQSSRSYLDAKTIAALTYLQRKIGLTAGLVYPWEILKSTG